MKAQYEDLLRAAAPNLYSELEYIEVKDGWFKPLLALSRELEPYGVKCAQVKEKFGGLRFYLQFVEVGPDETPIDEAILRCERACLETCEDCGERGERGGTHWIRVQCPECRIKP